MLTRQSTPSANSRVAQLKQRIRAPTSPDVSTSIIRVQLSVTYVVEDVISADAAADAGGRSKVNAKLPGVFVQHR